MLKHALLVGAMVVSTPALAQDQTAPATPPADQAATSAPAATREQIASIVDSEFPTYDKDTNGTLDAIEFANWMTALRSASDPTAASDSASMAKWANAAFAQADTDKSQSVSKGELIGFLSKAQG